jgi:hypothetical protein
MSSGRSALFNLDQLNGLFRLVSDCYDALDKTQHIVGPYMLATNIMLSAGTAVGGQVETSDLE